MNTISIELCAEDRARLDKLITGLAAIISQGVPCYGGEPKGLSNAVAREITANQHPVSEPFEELPQETPVPFEAPKVDRADIQRKVVELSAAGKKAEVRAIVMAYADKVSGIPEDKLAEVYGLLRELEG